MRTALALALCLCSHVAAQTVTVSGKVVDVDGKAVEGAKVYLVIRTWQPRPLEPLIKQTQSASDGSFAFPDLKPLREGQYASVIAVKEGYGAWGISLGPEAKTTDLEIRLPRAEEIAGQVFDKKGKPVEKVKVRVIDVVIRERDGVWEGWGVPEKLNILSTQTDLAGRFRIGMLPERAEVRLRFRRPHYAQWEVGGIKVGKKDIKINLPLAAQITGQVIFEKTKKPAAGVKVAGVQEWQPGLNFSAYAEATTDKHGRFVLDNLPPGNYSVFLMHEKEEPDWVAVPKRVEGLGEGKQAKCPDLVLTKGGLVTGKVIDQDTKRPLDKVTVNAYPVKGRGGGTSTITKADGTYRLRLPPGKWWVQVSGREGYLSSWELGWEEFRRDVEVTWGKTVTGINFALLKAAELKGIVVDPEGKPVPKAIVKRLWNEITAKDDGTFTLGGLKPDEPFTLYAFNPDRSLGTTMDVTPKKKQTEPLTVKLTPCAKVTGKVTDEKGQPIQGASVRAERQVPYLAGFTFIPIHTTTTDAEGRFNLKLPSGVEYNLRASAKGYGETQITKFLAEGEKDAGVLALKKADAFVAGKVTDPEGKPIQGARISVYGEGQPRERQEEIVTDAQGRYKVENLTPGKVSVSVSYKNLHEWRSNVLTGSTDVDFILAPEEEAIPRGKLKPGDVAPEITVARWLNGEGVKGIRALRGKVVLIQFACPYNPAVEAWNRHLTELHKKYAQKGLVIVAIYDASLPAEEVAKYVKGQGLPYPAGIVPETMQLGWNSPAFKSYGVQSVPSLFLIDREGKVRLVNPSFGELEKTLLALLRLR